MQITAHQLALAALMLGSSLNTVLAATPDEPQNVSFSAKVDGTIQKYVEWLPPGFDGKATNDVLLAFHGHGSDRWQFIRDARDECRGVRDVAARFKLIYVSPDYRATASWMGPKAEADVLQIIAELKQKHRIGRVFLAGGSMGGTGVLTFAALHPDLIAGVCSLNGTANLVEYEKFQDAIAASFGGTKQEVPDEYKKRSAELWPERFTMPVAFTSGGKDELVPPQSVLRLAEKLKQAGRKTLLLHREAGGHSTTYADTCAALEFVVRAAGGEPAMPAGISAEDQRFVAEELRQLLKKINMERNKIISGLRAHNWQDLLADADLFAKGVVWALRYETNLVPSDVALIKKALLRGHQRVDVLLGNPLRAWTQKRGRVGRGYVSGVDGSIQPYGVIVPANYDPAKPTRLDVVLHGSSRPTGLSKLRMIIAAFDDGDTGGQPGSAENFIELHPLGRVENCYRWADETDVFEAIESVCRNYNIDRDRVVLRGMSMGASGTWHLGLKHPDRFVAIGPYCGYVDTHRFSETPIPGFVKVGPLPPHQERGLHLLDSIDYAANAGIVPVIGAIGDKDVFFQSHVHMREVMEKEGLQMVNLISPGTGHVIDPVTHREQMRRIGEYVAKGLDHAPRQLRFVIWTLKYNRCHWIELLALKEHYERAEIVARVADDGSIEVSLAKNITQFAVHPPMLQTPGAKLLIGGEEVRLPKSKSGEATSALVFTQEKGSGSSPAIVKPSLSVASVRVCKGQLTTPLPRRFCACAARVNLGIPWWARGPTRIFAALPTNGRATCAAICP